MLTRLKDFFHAEKIYEYSILPFSEVTVIDPRRAERTFGGRECHTVVPFLIPYLVKSEERSNISVYAHAEDYHYYFKELSQRLKSHFGDLISACDTSPINEVECAVKAGLGSFGRNGLIINGRYGTYAFVGELFFSVPPSHPIFEGIERKETKALCLDCGACQKACPVDAICNKSRCISFINQKKRLDEGDEDTIIRSKSVWGCDICQQVCPMNKNAEETEIEFFRQNRTPYLTEELLDSMIEKGSFERRAYAWRGEAVVRRNIKLCQKQKNALQ